MTRLFMNLNKELVLAYSANEWACLGVSIFSKQYINEKDNNR